MNRLSNMISLYLFTIFILMPCFVLGRPGYSIRRELQENALNYHEDIHKVFVETKQTVIDQPWLESSPDLFEGDIVASKEQIAMFYGEEVAYAADFAGLLRNNENIVIDNDSDSDHNQMHEERELGVMNTYNLLWNTRDDDGKVVIPYVVQSNLESERKDIIYKAMKHVEDKTGIFRFKLRDNERDYIYFQNIDSDCYSNVGRARGGQAVNLSNGCGFGSSVHEICHALGFWHEQSRQDRDQYVTILWDNIDKSLQYNFKKESTNSLGDTYDYNSIMHYAKDAFGNPTWGCTPTEIKKDIVARIRFQKSDFDSDTNYCLYVKDGDSDLYDGQMVYLKPGGDSSDVNQYWIIESYKTAYNIVRFAGNPAYCLTVNYQKNIPNNSPIVVKKCNTSDFTYQKFILDQYNWDFAWFRWEANTNFLITRNTTAVAHQTYSLKLAYNGIDSYYNQYFKIEFVSRTTGRSATVNSYCKRIPMDTIDAKGHEIGQREGLSNSDILQLQLLYQCPRGPRNINKFCSVDCKCKLNQGNCSNNDQCEQGLMCQSDGTSISRCVTATPNPTKSPSIACSYSTQKQCVKNKSCVWTKAGASSSCILFNCTRYLSKSSCSRNSRKCLWKDEKCISKILT